MSLPAMLRVPLGDADFPRSLAARVKNSQGPDQQASTAAALRALNTAEISYATTYEDIGYTCSLSDTGRAGNDAPGPHGAMLIDDNLASGTASGYVFTAYGCTGTGVESDQLVALPAIGESEGRVFCTDKTAVIRYSDDGEETTCLTAGQPFE